MPFLLVAKARTILDQQRKLAVSSARGDIHAATTKIQIAVRDARERLMREGIREEGAVLEMMRAAASEAGFDEQESALVVGSFRGLSPASEGCDAGRLFGRVKKALSRISQGFLQAILSEIHAPHGSWRKVEKLCRPTGRSGSCYFAPIRNPARGDS